MKFLTDKSTISPGNIQFLDAIEPPLQSGGYNPGRDQ